MKRVTGRKRRHLRIKKKILGTKDSPRLVLHRGLKGMNVQLVDDIEQRTVLSLSTASKDVKSKAAYGGNMKAATMLGEALAKKAIEKGINRVLFDRSGYKYHGRIKALGESIHKNGLKFGKKEK